MSGAVNSILQNADYFILMLFRVGGLFFTSPIFGRVNIPQMAKAGLILAVSYLFFFSFPPIAEISYGSVFGYFLICAKELLMGISLSFVTSIFFSLTYIGGQLIDMQIGFGIVSVYDAQNNTQIPVVGNLLNLMLLLVFYAVNGHHRLIEIICITLEKLPIGNIAFDAGIGLVTLEVFALSFTLGVMVAMPVIASGLILEITFGMLNRTVPQLHMFVIGIPVKTLVGLIMVLITLPAFAHFSDRIFSEMFIGVEKMFTTFLIH